MTKYSKEILKNPNALRQKLEFYLQTPDKVEIYAQACEFFFACGNYSVLKFKPTWSW